MVSAYIGCLTIFKLLYKRECVIRLYDAPIDYMIFGYISYGNIFTRLDNYIFLIVDPK